MNFSDNRDNLHPYIFSSEISGKCNPFCGYDVPSVFCLQDKERYPAYGYSKNDPDDRILFPLNLFEVLIKDVSNLIIFLQILIIIIAGIRSISGDLFYRLC